MSRQPPPRAPGGPQRNERPGGPAGPGEQGWRSPIALALIGVLVVGFLLQLLLSGSGKSHSVDYSEFLNRVRAGQVTKVDIGESSTSTHITFKTKDAAGKEQTFTTTGPSKLPDEDVKLLRSKNIAESHHSQGGSALWGTLLTLGLPILLLIGFWVWMSRRAQGQMAGLMSIGRSRAKVYTTEKPKTTFADVAGYTGVKREINEVVDFLKQPNKFREIGARIPKGVLLVGPPGTGKTLIARAVAGEAGVPFMSITGSDFMEMFVGVGAARVRDLFQTARKQAPCIIFVDEIDSIGRKRGAGLGGGHDEREQTLNQLLSEMDGFETTEGIVMMAATNRPDILDPALLRPGRFDRQIVVPLPDLEERLPILRVHCRDKKIADDVDLVTVARGTPGMSGADLANLVNEAALFAVRRGAAEIHMEDFEAARDRILMGQRRESTVLSESEKEHTAYHEGGHAVLAYVLPHADPVHKVTILPTGMALGVTQQLPAEERHMYSEEYIEDMLCVMMGGRCAERVVFGELSTGAADDLRRSTETARRMVREWGMSERVGPMAWGQQGAVFLGEDLMHTRDYSDETARVVDEEVERILREQEDRAIETLREHRKGLDAVAKALREAETVDGAAVAQLVDEAFGKPVHPAPPPRTEPEPGPNGATDPDVTQVLQKPSAG
jgi:cell division protease FtsH